MYYMWAEAIREIRSKSHALVLGVFLVALPGESSGGGWVIVDSDGTGYSTENVGGNTETWGYWAFEQISSVDWSIDDSGISASVTSTNISSEYASGPISWFGQAPQTLVELHSTYEWEGPPHWGYPVGPERYDVHVSVSAYGYAYNQCEAIAAASCGCYSEASSEVDDGSGGGDNGVGHVSYSAIANGAAGAGGGFPQAEEASVWSGDEGYEYETHDALGSGHNSDAYIEGLAEYSVSLDDEFHIDTAGGEPEVSFSLQIVTDATSEISTDSFVWDDQTPGCGVAWTEAEAWVNASVSLTLGSPY